MRRTRPQKLTPLQQKKLYRTAAILLLVSIVWLLFAPQYGFFSLLGQRADLKQLQQETEALALENERLAEEIHKLKEDPDYLEDVARRDYGLLKPHERVYDFSKERKSKE